MVTLLKQVGGRERARERGPGKEDRYMQSSQLKVNKQRGNLKASPKKRRHKKRNRRLRKLCAPFDTV